MIYSDAYAYVARALARSSDTDRQATAQDAIKATIGEWNLRRDWRYLTMDTSDGFSVASCTVSGGGLTVTTTATNGFAGVNIGQTITDSASTSTTVATITSTTVITVTAALVTGTGVMVFGGDIPLRAGIDTYNLPSPVKRMYSVRLLTNQRPLHFKDQRYLDRMYIDQEASTLPFYYNTFNKSSFAQARQNGVIRVFPTSTLTDTIRARYIRPIAEPSVDADLLDMPDRYVYAFLTMARYYFLINFDAENARTGNIEQRAERLFKQVVYDDQSASKDRDVHMIPFVEWGFHTTLDGDDFIYS